MSDIHETWPCDSSRRSSATPRTIALKIALGALFCLLADANSTMGAEQLSGSDIIEAAKRQAFALQTVTFTMKVSLYPHSSFQFWAKAGMVRVEGNLPSGKERTLISNGLTVFAYNEAHYQEIDKVGKYLAFSRVPSFGAGLQSGPCWSPIEQCYRWLRIAYPDFQWSTIRDPAVWAQLRPAGNPTRVDLGGKEVDSLLFRNSGKASVKVLFDPARGFYPISWEVINANGDTVERCSANNFAEVQAGDIKTCVPLAVTYIEESHGPAYPRRITEYEITKDTLQINVPLSNELFTLDPREFAVETIYDKDLGTITDVSTKVSTEIKEQPNLPLNPFQNRRPSIFVVLNGVAIALLLIVLIVRRIRNRALPKAS